MDDKLFPQKFNNKTNGVTHRRWLMNSNPKLAEMISFLIGNEWVKNPDKMEGLMRFVEDDNVKKRVHEIKHENKLRLKNYVKKHNNIDIDEMSTTELIQFVQQNPSVLKRPIMVDERQFLVGYDEEEIEIFIPRELHALAECSCNAECPNFENCGKLRKGL